jgi:hypothetical protein
MSRSGQSGPLDAVEGAAVLLPGLHVLAVGLPEVGRQLARAGVQQVGVLQHLVVVVVLRVQAEGAGLDAHVDVLGDQDHRALRMLVDEVHHDADDLVVGLGGGQGRRQGAVDRLGLQEQAAGGQFGGRRLQRDALLDAVLEAADDAVEHAAGLAGVPRHLRHALLVVVEFLERHHRHEDVVLLEAEQAGRVVHQDVGVEDEQLAGGMLLGVHLSLLRDLHEFEHFGGVARRLDAAPFAPSTPSCVDDEGAALDAAHRPAVEHLLPDDAEQRAGGFLGVGEQLEGQRQLGLEALVRLQAVARDAVDGAAGAPELGVQIAELAGLGGAAGGVVFRVEVTGRGGAAKPLTGRRSGCLSPAGRNRVRADRASILHC